MPSSLRPLLARDGIFNLRDVGGLPTESGVSVRPRRVLRADALQRAASSAQALREFGVVRVIDLRDDLERERDGVFAGDGIDVVHHPVLDPAFRWTPVDEDIPAEERLPLRYQSILDAFGDRIGAAVESIADVLAAGGDEVVVFHCAVGKDRTGLVSMLVQRTVGAERDAVVSDYTRSSAATAVQALWLRYMGYVDIPEEELETGLWSARADTMERTIDWLDERHGGAEAYLRSAGLDEPTIEALRSTLLGETDE